METGENATLVLVIEDDPDLRDVVTTILELDLNACTATAEDGEEGLALAQELKPDAVLLDINLPRLSGLEVARRLKANPLTKAIPILAVTSESRSTTLAAGCDDHVGKPFDLFELVRKLKAYLQLGPEPETIVPNLVAV